jgi:tRNA (Thr-GGU) A37 N-methylase
MDIVLLPIGCVHSSERSWEYGSREHSWGEIVSETLLDEKIFAPNALEGLTEFSHVEVLFYLHGVSDASVVSGRRHPGSNLNRPQVGIFALKLSRQ